MMLSQTENKIIQINQEKNSSILSNKKQIRYFFIFSSARKTNYIYLAMD